MASFFARCAPGGSAGFGVFLLVASANAAPGVPGADPNTVTCSLGTHGNVTKDSGVAAANLICDEVVKQRAEPGHYRVDIDRLDKTTIVRLSYERPMGTPIDSRRITISGLDEITVAAPRLVEALVQRKDVKDTQRVDNVVGDEARVHKKKTGEFLSGAGFDMAYALGSAAPGMGFELDFAYEITQFAFLMNFGLTWTPDSLSDTNKTTAFQGMLGARYFITPMEVTPFVGAGLGATAMHVRTPSGGTNAQGLSNSYDGFGPAAYGEAGFEFMRTYKFRFGLGARFIFPFFSPKGDVHVVDKTTNTASAQTTEGRQYTVPVVFSLFALW